ncbi:MAG: glycosyltransferase [Pseudomonadota bacterium]
MTQPLRVLMVSDVYFPRINGVSTSIETFRQALGPEGVEVSLIAPRYGDEAEAAGITRVRGWPIPLDPEDRFVAYGSLKRAVLAAAPNHDIIHIQTPFGAHYAGLAAARAHRKPVLTTYHTLFEEYLHHYIPFLPARALRAMARSFSRSQCNAMNRVVVPSTAMAERLRDYGVETELRILPTGLPQAAFTPGDGARFRTGLGLDARTPVLLFVGRVAHEKNIGLLLQALVDIRKQYPDVQLLITGEGPAVPELQRQTEKFDLKGNVRFLGYLDRRSELPDAYASADAFIFASRTETQGLVLLEAMAQGCPVVGIPAMGTRDILGPERGCVPAPDDPAGFAQAVIRLLADPDTRARLAAEARIYAAEWSDEAMARRMAALYREMLNPP